MKTAPFKFKTRRPRPIEVQRYPIPRESQPDNAVPPGARIQGRIPMSKEEWWVSLWLDRKQYSYDYQYNVFGGGDHFYNLDFLVHTVPLYTMVEPLGNYWHTDRLGQDDRLRQLRIETALRDIAKLPMQFINVEDMISRDTVEAALERIFNAT
jgi:hypothetical protein